MRLERVESAPKELLLFFDKVNTDPIGTRSDFSTTARAPRSRKQERRNSLPNPRSKADVRRERRVQEIRKLRFRIIEFLKKNPEGISSRSIRDGVVGNAAAIDEARKELYAEGLIVFDTGPKGAQLWNISTTPRERQTDGSES